MTHFHTSSLMPASGSSRRSSRLSNRLVWFVFIGLGLSRCPTVQAQNFVWAKNTKNSFGFSVNVDGSGNVYTSGYFVGTVDFDPGPGVYNLTALSGEAQSDMFISKLNQLNVIATPNPVCLGNPVALSATVSGGTPPYSYTWVAPLGVTLSATNTAAVSATLTGVGVQTFTISITGSGGLLTSPALR